MVLTKSLWFLNLKNEIERYKRFLNPYLSSINDFKPKIVFKIDKGQYIIKTAHDSEDLEKVLRLRYEVFYNELLKKRLFMGLDIDKFDFICDHLIIEDKSSGDVIGTYRLNSSLYSSEFYSETEFDITNILKLPGVKLELGRACIHKDHRNGITITLLWEGLSEYIKRTGTNYLFGCSSIKTTNIDEIVMVEKYFRSYYYSSESLRVKPKKKFKINNLENKIKNMDRYDEKEARKIVPSLLKSYLKTGSVVCGEPALDKDFKCIDYLTLLNVNEMRKIVEKKFQLC